MKPNESEALLRLYWANIHKIQRPRHCLQSDIWYISPEMVINNEGYEFILCFVVCKRLVNGAGMCVFRFEGLHFVSKD